MTKLDIAPPPAWPAGVLAGTAPQWPGDAVPAGAAAVQWLRQVHGSDCIEARRETAASRPEADAAWTRERGLALAVHTADCVPIVICDRAAGVVGVAHGGWRGLVGGIVDSLVSAMPARPRELVAWLGPAIGPAAYEVGEDVAAAVRALPGGAALAADCLAGAGAGKHYLDLFTLTERLLAGAGVEAVCTDRLCTFSDPRLPSYRRDGTTGRMATFVWLEV